jgi:Protein of unknown function (DUF1761)
MEFVRVIAAALAAFAFGAVWYIAMAKPWMAASGVTAEQQRNGGPMPFVIGIAAMVLVAGMMRHVFNMGGIATLGAGVVSGAGIGAFLITPWVAMNYGFAQRPFALTVIDSVNAIVGCAIMGAVLTLL